MADELWQRMLGQVWASLDREAVDDSESRPVWSGRVEVTGEPGRLPSRLPVGDTSIACAGAAQH